MRAVPVSVYESVSVFGFVCMSVCLCLRLRLCRAFVSVSVIVSVVSVAVPVCPFVSVPSAVGNVPVMLGESSIANALNWLRLPNSVGMLPDKLH